MTFYLIAYDLRKPDYDYQPLYDKLASIRATRIQESVWVVCSNRSVKDIFDSLWAHMHNERDRLLVAQMGDDWRSINGMAKIQPLKDACR